MTSTITPDVPSEKNKVTSKTDYTNTQQGLPEQSTRGGAWRARKAPGMPLWGKTGGGEGGFGRGMTRGADSAAVGRGRREEEVMVRADS